MLPLSLQIILALLLDGLIGDPRWWPHPVKGIGRLAAVVEQPLRRMLPPRAAGICAVLIVLILSTGIAWLLCGLAATIHPLCGDLVAILILTSCFALQDLRRHALRVFHPLRDNDLPLARTQVAFLVGRDTETLNQQEIVRATVESVAENTVDGVTAPLLFALLGGPPAAILYKAINTLDSTWGHRNDTYLKFGWAAARLDDLANFLPARLSALLVPVSARLTGLNSTQAWRIFCRDRNNHPSPNGGQIEAAFAGALSVRLGGPLSYGGRQSFRPYMGNPAENLTSEKITDAIRLMITDSLLIAAIGLACLLLFQ